MLAVLTPGHSALEGSAQNQRLLISATAVTMGANIEGIGSHLLKIEGVKAARLQHFCHYS